MLSESRLSVFPASLVRQSTITLSDPRSTSLPDISTCAPGDWPSVIPVWLSGHLGTSQCTGTSENKKTWDVGKGCQERRQWTGSGATLWQKGMKYNRQVGALNH